VQWGRKVAFACIGGYGKHSFTLAEPFGDPRCGKRRRLRFEPSAFFLKESNHYPATVTEIYESAFVCLTQAVRPRHNYAFWVLLNK
jgi:hypothetical protein